MSTGMNSCTIVGRLGKDPEVRYTATGKAVVNLSVVTEEKYKGEKQSHWHRIVCWGKTAEIVGEYLHKGDMAGFVGKITYRQYEKDGIQRSSTEIVADKMFFVSSTKRNEDQAPAPAAAAQDEFDDDIPF